MFKILELIKGLVYFAVALRLYIFYWYPSGAKATKWEASPTFFWDIHPNILSLEILKKKFHLINKKNQRYSRGNNILWVNSKNNKMV